MADRRVAAGKHAPRILLWVLMMESFSHLGVMTFHNTVDEVQGLSIANRAKATDGSEDHILGSLSSAGFRDVRVEDAVERARPRIDRPPPGPCLSANGLPIVRIHGTALQLAHEESLQPLIDRLAAGDRADLRSECAGTLGAAGSPRGRLGSA